jgi:hypothetical protein
VSMVKCAELVAQSQGDQSPDRAVPGGRAVGKGELLI